MRWKEIKPGSEKKRNLQEGGLGRILPGSSRALTLDSVTPDAEEAGDATKRSISLSLGLGAQAPVSFSTSLAGLAAQGHGKLEGGPCAAGTKGPGRNGQQADQLKPAGDGT